MKLTEKEQQALDFALEQSKPWQDTSFWKTVALLAKRLIDEQPEPKIKLTLTEEEQEVIKRSKDWLDYYQLGGVFTPHLETCEIICRLLARIDKVAQEPESPQPEVKLIKTGMELTTEEWKAKDILQKWVKSYTGSYSPGTGSTVGCFATLLTAIDRETSKHADYKKEEQVDKPKIVIYYCESSRFMYANGIRVCQAFSEDNFHIHTAVAVLGSLGYEVDARKVIGEDMPPNPKTNYRGLYTPINLAELEDHFNNLENARRKVRIASLKDELQRLEQEDANA